MTSPLPQQLHGTDEYLSGLIDISGLTAARAELRDTTDDVLVEYLELDDALGAAKLPAIMSQVLDHPALTHRSRRSPVRPATPRLNAVALVHVIVSAPYSVH